MNQDGAMTIKQMQNNPVLTSKSQTSMGYHGVSNSLYNLNNFAMRRNIQSNYMSRRQKQHKRGSRTNNGQNFEVISNFLKSGNNQRILNDPTALSSLRSGNATSQKNG